MGVPVVRSEIINYFASRTVIMILLFSTDFSVFEKMPTVSYYSMELLPKL